MFRYSCWFVLLLISGSVHAQGYKEVQDLEKVKAALKKSSDAAQSVSADFQEEKHLAVFKEPQKSSGVFYYQKNDKMRWEQKEPARYVILINGVKMRVQEAGKEKNVGQAGRMAAQIKELMIGLVNGDFQENKAFSQQFQENNNSYMVTLTPIQKRLKNVYKKIDLVFLKSTMRLRELTFYQKDGDKSIMKFSNEKINKPIQESVFTTL